MRWPFASRRNSVDRARYEQVIEQRDAARKEAAEHVCKIVDLCRAVDSLTGQLAQARQQLAQPDGGQKPPINWGPLIREAADLEKKGVDL